MDKFADEVALRENGRTLGLDRIARVERVHKAAHLLALRQNGRTVICRMDKLADQATEMETGIWHDDFPSLKVRVPVVNFHAVCASDVLHRHWRVRGPTPDVEARKAYAGASGCGSRKIAKPGGKSA